MPRPSWPTRASRSPRSPTCASTGAPPRGGSPSATDRLLATRYGAHAADLVIAGNTGRMVALHGTEMTSVPLGMVEGIKTVDLRYLELARTFFG